MSPRVLHPEWRNYFAGNNYPFSDTATLVNTEGDQNFIPEDTFLDAALYPIGAEGRLYLSKVTVVSGEATLYIGDEIVRELASGTLDLIDPGSTIRLEDSYGRAAGILVSEPSRLLTFQGWTEGDHLFELDQTEFAARVITPMPEIGVRGFLLDDGTVVTGDIWFTGDDGVVLTPSTAAEPDPANPSGTREVNVIRVDVVGDPLFRRRLCGDIFNNTAFLKQLTLRHNCRKVVCEGDDRGNVTISVGSSLAADTVLRIRTTADGITFETVGERMESLTDG
jgi:hypothetical protein